MSMYDPFWRYREIQRALDRMRPAFDIQKMLPSSYFENLSFMEKLTKRYSLPPDYLNVSDRLFESLGQKSILDSMSTFEHIGQSRLFESAELYKSLASTLDSLGSSSSALDQISNSFAGSLASVEALSRTYSIGQSGIDALLRYNDPFEGFAKSLLADAVGASDIFKMNTAALISEASTLLPELAYVSEMSAITAPSLLEDLLGLPDSNLFEEMRHDLQSVDFEDEDLEVFEAVAETPSAKLVEVGGKLVGRVYDLNTESERGGKGPVFSPTTQTMMAFHRVPSTVVVGESGFLEIVDSLYFLLYEGSGDASRLTARVDGERLQALWLLKHLRLGARHDLDHGRPTDVAKKMKSVGEAYVELIGVPVPKTKGDWQKAQLELYVRLVDMLDELWFGEE